MAGRRARYDHPVGRPASPVARPHPRRWQGLRPLVLGLLAAVPLPDTPAFSQSADFQVRLRNDLTAGAVAAYDVLVRGVRTLPDGGYDEELTFEQTGRLTLAILDTGKSEKETTARRAWMMELGEPRVVSFTRDGETVVDVPDPKTLGLPPKIAQLNVSSITSARAAASAVGGSLVQRAGLLLALDFAYWPDDLVRTGASWENPAQREELNGAWTHRYDAVEGTRSERLAVGGFEFKGELAGSLTGAAIIERVSGTFKWRVAKRVLHSSSADVVLRYGDPGRVHRLVTHVELALTETDRLEKQALAAAVEELNALGTLADAVRDAGDDKAKDALRSFVAAHPKSLWLPVAQELLERIDFDTRTLEALGGDQLVGVLTALVTRWQTIALRNQIEPLEPVRATFRKLMGIHSEELHKLTAAGDPNVRAMAVFCVAFGDRREDLARVTLVCADPEPRVRAWAAYGLAERRDVSVDPNLLARLLTDPDVMVRQRACMAIQGCVRPDSPHRERFFRQLLEMVAKDEAEAVRVRVVDALGGLATKADLPALIEAAYEQEVPPAQTMLVELVRRLGGTPRSYDEGDNG